jgi:hypothetical protein
MAKERWNEARWVKRAQRARALAKNMRTPVRRRMMLEMAEFYDRKAHEGLQTVGGIPGKPGERGQAPRGTAPSLFAPTRRTLSIERKWSVGVARSSKRPQGRFQGKRRTSPHDPTRACAMCEGRWRRGTSGRSDRNAPGLSAPN